MPVRVRLLLAYLVAAAVLVGGGGILFERQLRVGLYASVDAALRVRASEVEQAVAEAGSDLNFQDQPEQLATPRAAFTQIFRPDGSVSDASEAIGDQPLLSPAELAAARRGPERLTRRRAGESLRLLAVPVRRAEGDWVVVVGSSLEPTLAALARVRGGLVVGGAVLVLLGGLGAWLLAGAALRPVERMRREAADLHDRDPAGRLAVPGTRDEVAALARTFNDQLARQQTSLGRQRRLVADAGHELRGPLAVLRAELELAGRPGRSRAELSDAVANAAAETDRLGRLAENLLLLARSDEGIELVQPRRQPLAPVLGASVDAMRRQAGPRGIGLRLEVADGLEAPVDAEQLRRAVDNLLDNALRVAPPGTDVLVRACARGGKVLVEVVDEGPGFPPAFLPHAFERFRRADVARGRDTGGAGLGLAIVRTIAEAHGGHGEASNHPDGGAVVGIVLPAGSRDKTQPSAGSGPAGQVKDLPTRRS